MSFVYFRQDGAPALRAGFTLIELLVTVLIIGILSAAALPQYAKAVEKSRAVQGLTLLKAFYQAQQSYYMANGAYASKIEDLDLDLAWKGKEAWYNGATDTRSNGEWSLQVNPSWGAVYMGRLKGAYTGTGFLMAYAPNAYIGNPGQIQCLERKAAGVTFSGDKGAFCQRVMGGVYKREDNGHLYTLP